MRNRHIYLVTLLLASVGLFLASSVGNSKPVNSDKPFFHTVRHLGLLRTMADSLPEIDNDWFITAGGCDGCHGSDVLQVALVSQSGEDINPVDDWVSTMMANSAKDPFWLAQVSHEVINAPGLQAPIEDKCLSCHAPMGRYSHFYQTGQENYSIAQLHNDTLGLDGVSCVACHSQPSNPSPAFSGQIPFDTTRIIWGQYPGPLTGPMAQNINYTVAYGPHIQDSELCASCHTLITESLDLTGTPTGNSFFEQATYHEWLNSDYAVQGTECQGCHIPQIEDNVIIATGVSILPPRRPYGKHHLVGANAFMLRMMKEHRDSLGILADSVNFDSTIARTERMLGQQTMDLQLTQAYRANDTAAYELRLTNLAGHKFPSGYPSRRAIVEFIVEDINGDTLFSSGVLGADYEVIGQDPIFEPHYDLINDPDQAQIYEFIMGDVNGDVTTTLERGDTLLKDNRLPPLGFTTTHSVYDTTRIAGLALNDPNFNRDGANEGTGADIVRYRVALGGYTDSLLVTARVWYQTVRPGWLDEMFANTSPEIDRFKAWYQASDRSNVLVAEGILGGPSTANDLPHQLDFSVYPNPSSDGNILIGVPEGIAPGKARIYDMQGRLLQEFPLAQTAIQLIRLPEPGVYLIELSNAYGRQMKRVVYLD